MSKKRSIQVFYKLSKKITQVYFSNLRFKLKNDCVCRLIAETFPEVSSVSILLYESKEDALINFGHYFDPERAVARFSPYSVFSEIILKNISLYEYFATQYELNTIQKCTLTDYKSYSFFKSEVYYDGNSNKLTEALFEELRGKFISNNEYESYLKYKSIIARKDLYHLRHPKTISGSYFHDLVIGSLTEVERKYKHTTSNKISTQSKVLYKIYTSDLSIEIGNEYHYFAIPLLVNDRYIGLIRFLGHFSSSQKSLTEEQLNEIWPGNDDKRELYELTEMIANHIENDYSNYEFRKRTRSNLLDFNEYARLFSTAINCRGCFITANDHKDSDSNLVGWTNSVEVYATELRKSGKAHFLTDRSSLDELFHPVSIRDQIDLDIIAIQFDLKRSKIENMRYMYFSKNEIFRTTNDFSQLRINKEKIYEIINDKIIADLENELIHHILFVKIPNIDNGFITFVNTKFRPIVPNDIHVIYPQINRLGSELYIRQKEVSEKKSDLLRAIYHELQTPVELAVDKGKKLNAEIDRLLSLNPYELTIEVAKILTSLRNNPSTLPKEFLYLLKFIDSRFSLLSVTNDVDRNEFFPTLHFPYSLPNELSAYIAMFKEFANSKFGIEIIKDWDDSIGDKKIYVNDNIFLGLFMYLMRNALKYSFKMEDRKKNIPGYDQLYSAKSDGHIKVNCFFNEIEYGYSITNWGKEIPAEYQKDIFKLGVRCPLDPKFETEKNPIDGQGIGLYYAKKFADIISGEIVVVTDGCKTKFTVKWKI